MIILAAGVLTLMGVAGWRRPHRTELTLIQVHTPQDLAHITEHPCVWRRHLRLVQPDERATPFYDWATDDGAVS